MANATFSSSIVTTTTTAHLPAEVAELSNQYGLTVSEVHDVQVIVTEHNTNLPTVRNLLDDGLSVAEVSEVYDTRDRLNLALESTPDGQQVSLRAIVTFQRQFPELALDADCLTEHMLELHESLSAKYFTSALNAVTEAARWYDHCFAAVLAAYLNGEVEETDA